MPTSSEDVVGGAAPRAVTALAEDAHVLPAAPVAPAPRDRRASRDRVRGPGAAGGEGPGYGPLVPDPGGFLALPAGFSCRVLSRGGATVPGTGERTPAGHGGVAALAGADGTTLLVGSHGPAGARRDGEAVYDPAAPGGCTLVEVPRNGERVSERVALAGTSANRGCGATPWGTWLTCEGGAERAGEDGMTRDHGYVFEVDPRGPRTGRGPEPVRALGRFEHRSVAVDPRRGHLYLTEADRRGVDGLLHRWSPPRGFRHGRGRLGELDGDAGALQALRCLDSGGRFVADLSGARRPGTVYGVDWVDVPDRDAREVPVRRQFGPDEVTGIRGLRDMWWADGGAYLLVSPGRAGGSSAHAAERPHGARVWFYAPGLRTLRLCLVLPGGVSEGGVAAASPRGGVVVAEDGGDSPRLTGVDARGRTYPIARREAGTGAEGEPRSGPFTGLCFSEDGRTLFACVRGPDALLAVTGPWSHG